MTREFRLMLAEQGAADPELMGGGVTAPKSAAEVMRELAASAAEWAHLLPPDGGSPTAGECAVARNAAHLIRALLIPADPRDAEIARLREALKQIASCESHHPDDVVAVARATLAQSGGAE